MKKLLLLCLLLTNSLFLQAQSLEFASFQIDSNYKDLSNIEIIIDGTLYNIDRNGEIVNFSFPNDTAIYNYYDDVDFGDDPDSEIKYYDMYDEFDLQGKLKSVRGTTISYYDRFNIDKNVGKIQKIGDIKFEYYSRFDDSKLEGKIKQIGTHKISYFDKFDTKYFEYKIKAIGPIKIEYYDGFTSKSRAGRLKKISGNKPTFFAYPTRSMQFRDFDEFNF